MQDDLETLQQNPQQSLVSLQIGCKRNGMLLNTDKTKLMLITTRRKRVRLDENLFTLTYNNVILQLTTGDKILGVNTEQNLQWNNHFQCVSRKVSSYIWLLSKIKSNLSTEHRRLSYNAYMSPHLDYCNTISGNSSDYNVSKITKLQRQACKVILEVEYKNLESARSRLNILSFDQAVFLNKAKIMYKVVNVIAPQYIRDIFQLREDTLPNNSLRSVSNNNFTFPMPRTSLFKDSLSYSGPAIWNAIPSDVKNVSTINAFTRKMINWIKDAPPQFCVIITLSHIHVT